jgi:hypothetical protein
MTARSDHIDGAVVRPTAVPVRIVKVDRREGTYGANAACFCMRDGVRRGHERMSEAEAVQRGYHLAECCARLDREELAGGRA